MASKPSKVIPNAAYTIKCTSKIYEVWFQNAINAKFKISEIATP
jgi:hypothetical protein